MDRPAHNSEPEPRIWGGPVIDLHDRLWAGRGVQVVRPGGAPVVQRGPSLYALLGPAALTEFPLDPPVKRLHWGKPRAVRIRIVDRVDRPYREVVHTHPDGRLIGIRREYSQRTSATGRAWLTPDAALARRWRDQVSLAEASASMRRLSRQRQTLPVQVGGVVASAHDGASAARWLGAASPDESNADRVCAGVYPHTDLAWAHETSRIDPSVRVVGRVLVGLAREVPAGSVLVGPGVLFDDPSAPTPAPAPVPWDELRSSDWQLTKMRGLSADLRRGAKRAFDIAFSAGVLTATLPLYPVLMALIYREDGRPFFFAHERQTLGGRDFPCYKFRTMCRDAERMKAELARANQADGPQFFIEDDPRLLRVGRVMRKFQLDELPQFYNVLLGHMSVVGPRPSPDKENQYSPAWREARLSVRPGVTGLWQVRRTREPLTDFQEWIRYDLEYVRHYSFGRDIRIILETIAQLLKIR